MYSQTQKYTAYTNDPHIKQLSYYQTFLFLVRAACELRSVSYGFKHVSRTLLYMPFCTYLHEQVENLRLYNDAVPDKRLLYYRRFLFSGLELYARYNRRLMDPDMHRNLFMIRHFVPTYTHNSKTTGRI